MGLLGGQLLCLPFGALISGLFLLLACKILKEDRPFGDIYKAAIAYSGVMFVLNVPLQLLGVTPAIAGPLQLIVAATVGGFIYAAVLEMDTGKAFLAWLTQHGIMMALCCVVVLPLLFVTGGMEVIAKRLQSQQVAQTPQAVEPEPASQENPAPADSQPDGEAPAEAMPAEPAGDAAPPEPEPTPESAPPESTPSETPTPASDSPAPNNTPEPTSNSPDAPAAPVAPPEVTFPAGFQGDAQRAFHQGRIADGNNYLRAALLTSDERALWDHVRWCPALGRPVIGLRWGLGLQMAEPPPLAAPQQGDGARVAPQSDDGANLNNAEPAAENAGDNRPSGPDLSELRKFTGEFGPKLLEALPKNQLSQLLGSVGPGFQTPAAMEFVGVGTDLNAVQSLARQKGVDVLLVAAVNFKVVGIKRNIDANLTVRLIDVATEKRLWTSKTINSNQVKAAMNKGQDPTAETVRGLTDFLEHNFHLQEKPDLDRPQAQQRADAATRAEATNPLPALVEVRYYQLKGLLTPLQAEVCYQRLVDYDNAAVLASGSLEERRRVLERFLPRNNR